MTDRRRFPRYVFLSPVGGCARAVSDCLVEAWDQERAIVLTTHAAGLGETFVMQFHSGSSQVITRSVRVVSSTPVQGGATTRFRVQLSVGPEPVQWRSHPIPTI